jgi:hypothetical protein
LSTIRSSGFYFLGINNNILVWSKFVNLASNPNLKYQVSVFMPPNEKVAQDPGSGFPFRRLPRLVGQGWRYSNPPPYEILKKCLTGTIGIRNNTEQGNVGPSN